MTWKKPKGSLSPNPLLYSVTVAPPFSPSLSFFCSLRCLSQYHAALEMPVFHCVCLFVRVVLLPITCPWSIIKLRYPNSPLKCWKRVGHSVRDRSQLRGLGMFYFAPRLMPFMELAKCSHLESCGLNNRVINTRENPFRNKNIFT